MGIKQLPKLERPREKALHYGLDTLSNNELLSIIISSGTKDKSALDISYELLNNYNGLFNLFNANYLEYTKIKGISKIKALKLGAIFELYKRISQSEYDIKEVDISANYIYDKYSKIIRGIKQEMFGIIILDSSKKIVREKMIYKGTRSDLAANYLDIFKEMIIADGKYFYIFHNHPEGNPIPSDKDILFTSGLIKECTRLSFHLIDHIIIGDKSYYSFLKSETVHATNN